NLEHVLEPSFGPTSNRNVTAHLRLFRVQLRNERCEPAAVTDAENVNAIRVNEVVILERTKRSAITGEFRIGIGFAGINLAVTASLLINAEKTEIWNLSETAKAKCAG